MLNQMKIQSALKHISVGALLDIACSKKVDPEKIPENLIGGRGIEAEIERNIRVQFCKVGRFQAGLTGALIATGTSLIVSSVTLLAITFSGVALPFALWSLALQAPIFFAGFIIIFYALRENAGAKFSILAEMLEDSYPSYLRNNYWPAIARRLDSRDLRFLQKICPLDRELALARKESDNSVMEDSPSGKGNAFSDTQNADRERASEDERYFFYPETFTKKEILNLHRQLSEVISAACGAMKID